MSLDAEQIYLRSNLATAINATPASWHERLKADALDLVMTAMIAAAIAEREACVRAILERSQP